MGGKVALVTGATGIIGRHVVMHLQQLNDWEVYAITRKGKLKYEEISDVGSKVHAVNVDDLTQKESCSQGIKDISGVTHILHCAYSTVGDEYQDAMMNLAMLKCIVEAVEEGSSNTLEHVYIQSGSKWYGKSKLVSTLLAFCETTPSLLL